MIRLVVNFALLYSLCCVFSLFSTGIVGEQTAPCEPGNFSVPFNITDSEQCDKFYTCKNSTSLSPPSGFNVTLIVDHCGPGLRFSTELMRCDEATKVNCTGRTLDHRVPIKNETCLVANGKFLCSNGKDCINSSQLCDGKFDCLDASDEFETCKSVCDSNRCAQICVKTPPTIPGDLSTGGTCLCRDGFKIHPENPSLCLDINECDTFGTCSQICSNAGGSFQCGCIQGFKVTGNDSSSCEPQDPEWKLIYATKMRVEMVSHPSPRESSKVELSEFDGRPVGVAFDARKGIMFWTDASANQEKIYMKPLNGLNGSEHIIADSGILLPEGIALDWITGNIYFADSNLSHIAVCGPRSNLCSVLVQEFMDQPRDIALYPTESLMFWTDWGESPAIMKAGMDGLSPHPIVSSGLKWPNGITVDQGNGRLYWVDAGLDKIETVLMDGQGRQVIISQQRTHPFGVDIFGDRIFWSDWSTLDIKSANKLTGTQKKVEVSGVAVPINGVEIYHVANQPMRPNPCVNSRCSHICTLSPSRIGNFRCLCPAGMILDLDGKTCVEVFGREKLVIAFKNTIKIMRFDTIGRDIFEVITFSELKTISAVVYNPVNHTVIMSDSSHKKIYEYNLNRKILSVLIDQHLDFVKGMDIDIVGENLYWVDAGKSSIEMMSFRTRARTVLQTGVDNPADILLVPQFGLIYVARIGSRGGKIYKMNMNGDSYTLFKRVGEKEPMGLTYDKDFDLILWADKVNRGVESISTNGDSSNVIVTHQEGPPSDVIKHGNKIYWTDMFTENLKFVSLGNQFVRPIALGEFENNSTTVTFEGTESSLDNSTNFFPKMALIHQDISSMDPLRNAHECSWKNPNRKACSHICVMSGQDFTGSCVCPEGLSLDEDGRNCIKVSTCSVDQFTCSDGHCISREYLCDGIMDCSNHEDEVNCRVKDCPEDHFKCQTNGVCIPNHWVCDGETDCPDSADEQGCTFLPCNEDFDFKCDSGRCIPKSWQCDHAFDCPGDNSDERGCNFTCPDGFFQCTASQACILATWVCDKEKDCEDGSDEMQNCSNAGCPNQFSCQSGKCIELSQVCDGSADCGSNEDEAHCNHSHQDRDEWNVTVVPVREFSDGEGNGTTIAIVLGSLIIIVLVAVIIALVLHKRNVQPKVLIRPYVQQWNRHIYEPARRAFHGRNGSQKLDCEMNAYDDVYANGTATYYNASAIYEEVDGDDLDPSSAATRRDKKDEAARGLVDSGILGSERESLYEEPEDCGNHYVSFSQKDKLISD